MLQNSQNTYLLPLKLQYFFDGKKMYPKTTRYMIPGRAMSGIRFKKKKIFSYLMPMRPCKPQANLRKFGLMDLEQKRASRCSEIFRPIFIIIKILANSISFAVKFNIFNKFNSQTSFCFFAESILIFYIADMIFAKLIMSQKMWSITTFLEARFQENKSLTQYKCVL